MAFILESIIEEIYVAYENLPTGRDPLPRNSEGKPMLGNLEKYRNAHHRVVWTLTGGDFNAPTKIGGPDAAAYQAGCKFLVWIWQKDLETCWTVMVDLLAAMRSTIFGPNLGPQTFLAPTETEGRDIHDGEVFVLTVNLSVPIPLEGSVRVTEVALTSHQSTITTGNESAVIDDSYVAIETVVIAGPPED